MNDNAPTPSGGCGPLPCPHCGDETEFSVLIDTADGPFVCGECGTEFTPGEIRAKIARFAVWERVLAWHATIPNLRS